MCNGILLMSSLLPKTIYRNLRKINRKCANATIQYSVPGGK